MEHLYNVSPRSLVYYRIASCHIETAKTSRTNNCMQYYRYSMGRQISILESVSTKCSRSPFSHSVYTIEIGQDFLDLQYMLQGGIMTDLASARTCKLWEKSGTHEIKLSNSPQIINANMPFFIYEINLTESIIYHLISKKSITLVLNDKKLIEES